MCPLPSLSFVFLVVFSFLGCDNGIVVNAGGVFCFYGRFIYRSIYWNCRMDSWIKTKRICYSMSKKCERYPLSLLSLSRCLRKTFSAELQDWRRVIRDTYMSHPEQELSTFRPWWMFVIPSARFPSFLNHVTIRSDYRLGFNLDSYIESVIESHKQWFDFRRELTLIEDNDCCKNFIQLRVTGIFSFIFFATYSMASWQLNKNSAKITQVRLTNIWTKF